MRVQRFGYLLITALALIVLSPRASQAQDQGPPSFLSYGFSGFWTGAPIGLSIGYLSTGSRFESGEWRNLVLGTGIGALTGLGVGIVLAVVDVGSQTRPATGEAILRDTGYGTLLGAVAGGAVGALVWVDHGRSKDVLVGMSIGALIGAGAGIAFGIIESSLAKRHREAPPQARGFDLHFTMGAAPALPGSRKLTLMPTVVGTF